MRPATGRRGRRSKGSKRLSHYPDSLAALPRSFGGEGAGRDDAGKRPRDADGRWPVGRRKPEPRGGSNLHA